MSRARYETDCGLARNPTAICVTQHADKRSDNLADYLMQPSPQPRLQELFFRVKMEINAGVRRT